MKIAGNVAACCFCCHLPFPFRSRSSRPAAAARQQTPRTNDGRKILFLRCAGSFAFSYLIAQSSVFDFMTCYSNSTKKNSSLPFFPFSRTHFSPYFERFWISCCFCGAIEDTLYSRIGIILVLLLSAPDRVDTSEVNFRFLEQQLRIKVVGLPTRALFIFLCTLR